MNATIVRAIVTKDIDVAVASLAKSSVVEINQIFTRSNAGIKFKPYTILDVAILESKGEPKGSPGRQIVDLLRAKGARTYMELIHIPPLAVVAKRGIVQNGIRSQATAAAAPAATAATAAAAPVAATVANSKSQQSSKVGTTGVSGKTTKQRLGGKRRRKYTRRAF
jgi:hypothetical protein